MLKTARMIGGCLLLVLVSTRTARCDEPARPTLLDRTTAEEILNRQQYLSSGGLAFRAADGITVEPLLGIGHDLQHRDYSLFARESAHSITARAGGRISFLEGMYVAATLKYPLYSFQSSTAVPSGAAATPAAGSPEFLNLSGTPLTWTGEIGTSLGKGISSFLYYDKVTTPLSGGVPGRTEDRIGIRFQINFK